MNFFGNASNAIHVQIFPAFTKEAEHMLRKGQNNVAVINAGERKAFEVSTLYFSSDEVAEKITSSLKLERHERFSFDSFPSAWTFRKPEEIIEEVKNLPRR